MRSKQKMENGKKYLIERREVMTEHITTQVLETLEGKSVEAKEKVTELENKFHALEVALQNMN
jgi:IS4 transposase